MTDPKSIARAFGAEAPPVLLAGGRGRAARAGAVVIKSVDDVLESVWLAETFSTLGEPDGVRIPRPVKSANGNWIEEGHAAWTFVEGAQRLGCYREKASACDAYHALVAHLAKPDFLDVRIDPWSVADRKAWDEQAIDYESDFAATSEMLLAELSPLALPCQVIHGDFAGNVLFADGPAPAVIDFTPYWRPADFARAILLIDLVVWEDHANLAELRGVLGPVPHIRQLTLRATLRRMFEQFEHVRMGRLDGAEALLVAGKYAAGFRRLFD